MTASIVGWAHTAIRQFDTETGREPGGSRRHDALADAGISWRRSMKSCLGIFNAGFSPQDFTASLVLQADPQLRSSRPHGSRTPARRFGGVHQGIRAIRRVLRRSCWWSGSSR